MSKNKKWDNLHEQQSSTIARLKMEKGILELRCKHLENRLRLAKDKVLDLYVTALEPPFPGER